MRNLLLAVVLAQFPIEAFSQVPVNLFTLDYIVMPLCEIQDGAYLYSPNNETFLGYFNGEYRSQDILNTGSAYGSQNSSTSIRNPLSDFGKAINDENASYLSLPKLFGVLRPGQPVVHIAYISNKRTGRGFVALDDILSCYSSGPLAVTSLSAAQELNDISLTWEASAGATSYDVFSAASATAAQSFLVNTTETNVVVEDVSAGSTIYYFIYPKNSTGTGDGVYINVYAGSPSALQALSASDGTYADEIVLTWEAAEGADIYKVLTAETLEGPRTELGYVEGTTVTLEGFVQETTYFFTVYPFNSICYSCDSGVGQLDTGFTSVSGLRNEAPVVAINGGDQIVDDSDGDIGEVVSVSATATDTDGELASTSWLVGGEVVASGTSANLTLGDGSTTVTFRATDDEGESTSTNVTITVVAPVIPNLAPVVAIIGGDRDFYTGETVSLSATATDADGEIVSSSWLIDGEVVASGTVADLALPEGQSRVYFQATDDRGNTTDTSVDIKVVSSSPVVELQLVDDPAYRDFVIIDNGSIMLTAKTTIFGSNRNIRLQADISDPNGSIRSTQLLADGEIISNNDHSGSLVFFLKTLSVPLGTTVLTFQATDNDGNITSVSFKITLVNETNLPPMITLSGGSLLRVIPDTDGVAGEVVTVSATATDADGEIASSLWLVGGEKIGSIESIGGLVSSDWVIDGEVVASGASANLSLADGENRVTFRAIDDDGNIANKSVGITVEAPTVINPDSNVAPVVAIIGGNRSIVDTDGVAGEVVSVTATATDSDGELASTSWLVGGEVVASGTSARLALSDGSTMVTFRATDDDGDSKSTSVTITVEAPVETEEEFVTEYNGISAPSFLSEEINTVSVFDINKLKLRSCIRLTLGGEPYSLNGYEQYDMNFNLLSLDDLTFRLVDFRPFNLNGSRNQFGETPDCSGQFELSSNVYKDIIAVPGTTEAGNLRYDYYDLVLDLIDMDSFLFRLRDISIIAGAD